MFVMIGSGWKIYQDEVLFGWLHFPDAITIGGGPEGALQWHFLGMWILTLNGLAYLVYGLATGRFRRKLFPIRLGELFATIRDALHFRLRHDDLTHYNMVQRLLYIGIILIGIVQVLSGLAIWKPVQFSELAALFLVVHVALALLVPRSLLAMLTGGPKVAVEEAKPDGRAAPATVSTERAG
jgi:thiosulfate reductase cytochrome b subunit